MILKIVANSIITDALVVDIENIGIDYSVSDFAKLENVLFCIIQPFNRRVIAISYYNNCFRHII